MGQVMGHGKRMVCFVFLLCTAMVFGEDHISCNINYRHILLSKPSSNTFGSSSAIISYEYPLNEAVCKSLDSIIVKSKKITQPDVCLDALDASAIVELYVEKKSKMNRFKLFLSNCDELRLVEFEKAGKWHKETLPDSIFKTIRFKKARADSLNDLSVDSGSFWRTGS
jgi:hypothetical protein